MKFIRAAYWINAKLFNRVTAAHSWYSYVDTIVVHYYAAIIEGFNAVELHNFKSFICSCWKKACSSSMWLIYYDRNMNANGVEKECFVVLNVKLQVRIRFKRFLWIF